MITPNYYKDFKCIADKCSHNCCTGWDIEIDIESFEKYKTMPIGIKEKIVIDDGVPYFKAESDGRCPFFNQKGLCDIISQYGENALCQICSDHPRFKNFYTEFTEIGIGMCCEEAARLILSQTEKFYLSIPEPTDVTECSFFKLRQTVFDILQDREFSIDERFENITDFFGIRIPQKTADEWKEFFKNLEILDSEWILTLDKMSDCPIDTKWDCVFEQLACYFVFRHLSGALDDGLYTERIGFCIIACRIIRMICAGFTSLDFEKIADVCRAFSSEIEYSDQNPQTIFGVIK